MRAPGYVRFGNNSDDYRKPIIATYMEGYHKPIIATYEMDYGKGKVIVFGIYSDDVMNENKFIRFLDRVLLKYT